MSQATTSTSSFMSEDFALGSKVLGHALQALGTGVAIAIAWSCSSAVMGVAVFIGMFCLMSILMALLHMVLLFKLPTASITSLGSVVGRTSARVSGLFTRKAAA